MASSVMKRIQERAMQSFRQGGSWFAEKAHVLRNVLPDGCGKAARVAHAASPDERDKLAHAAHVVSPSEPSQAVHTLHAAAADDFGMLAYRAVKRTFDVALSAGAIVVGAAPSLLLCAFIARDVKGNPFYSQIRVGKGGVPFRIYKFRTMYIDSQDVEKYFTDEQMQSWSREVKVEDDPRVTKLGAFLRSASIDEFPQFVNVLFGQMSVVGPRPITFEELEYFGDDASELLSCKPGITGMWQTGPRNAATFESGERQKIELSYVRQASLRLDLELILRTFYVIAKRTGK